jgi:hypothetical protein
VEPSFYGIIPDNASKRLAILAIMTLAGTCKMLALMLALGLLLAAKRARLIAVVYGVRFAIMFGLKIARRDLASQYPTRGVVTAVAGFLQPIVVAVLVDFTDFIFARHPYVCCLRRCLVALENA